ncbi:MAG: hypothetical protein NZ519_14090 [Bacteroidia bacterium]|nr:hypothetical protein [Bacteroidia bacterium]MDW8345313.1 hypothetical protein [Bacteroidia bacterium]
MKLNFEPERAKTIYDKVLVTDLYEKENLETEDFEHIMGIVQLLKEKTTLFSDDFVTLEGEECLLICSKTRKVKGYCLVLSVSEKIATR